VNTPYQHAARADARVALVTCAKLPELDADDRLVLEPLAQLGITAEPVIWDDPGARWDSYDLVVLRNPWDYVTRRDEFLQWAHTLPGLLNPPAVAEWNTDKRYLAELAAAGVPVTPTTFVGPADLWLPPSSDAEYVIKPTVSAGSRDTGRYGPDSRDAALAHLARLQAAGRITMIQPYLSAVDGYGETALLYFADPVTGRLTFSHSIRKGPMLQGPDDGDVGLYKEENITPRTPTDAELGVGEAVVGSLPQGLLYARVDLIPDREGNPLLVEVELTEPSLFLEHAPGSAARFAAAIAAKLPPHR
jgi:hypothetical protein